jgi:hypothetical protein
VVGRGEVTTYEQLQAMTPQQRHEHFLVSIVWDRADLRPNEQALLDRAAVFALDRERRLPGEAS